MPIFTLWLQNRITLPTNPGYTILRPVSVNTDQTITTWNVNFDALFKGQNYKYKKCRVRTKALNITNSNPTFANSLSYYGCSLSSNYNDTKLLTPTLFNLNVLVNTTVSVQRVTFISSADTAGSKGCNVNMPFGSQLFTITFGEADDLTVPLEFTSAGVDLNYTMLLLFELYDPIEEQ